MKSETFDRFAIYEKQQKGYNIINCYPKSMSSSLRMFPKLTLENKLIENARYYNKYWIDFFLDLSFFWISDGLPLNLVILQLFRSQFYINKAKS